MRDFKVFVWIMSILTLTAIGAPAYFIAGVGILMVQTMKLDKVSE